MHGIIEKIDGGTIRGWACDLNAASPVQLRAQLENRTIATSSASVPRPDVAQALGAEQAETSGFSMKAGFSAGDAGKITVQASSDGKRWVDLPRAKSAVRAPNGAGTYQDFNGDGASRSRDKLNALRLHAIEANPGSSAPLAGKSVLDIGCNEGFFCAEAVRQGASRVLGLDYNNKWIEKAKVRVPQAEFRTATWWQIPDEKFDVIFFLSAIHYEANQKKLLRKLVDHLTLDGVLVLECGVNASPKKNWSTIRRGDGPKRYPSLQLLRDDLLSDYGVRRIGPSVNQAGDPIPRFVFHCRPRRPVAMVIAGGAKIGKTALANDLGVHGIPAYDSDSIILRLLTSKEYSNTPLARALIAKFGQKSVDNIGAIGLYISENDALAEQFCEQVVSEVPIESGLFSIEGEIFHRKMVREALMKRLAGAGVRTWMVQRGEDRRPAG